MMILEPENYLELKILITRYNFSFLKLPFSYCSASAHSTQRRKKKIDLSTAKARDFRGNQRRAESKAGEIFRPFIKAHFIIDL